MPRRVFKFTTLHQLDALYRIGHVRQLGFKARTAEEARAWQRKLRRKVLECLAKPEAPACGLDPVVTAVEDTPDFVRRHVVIRAEADADIPLYVLVPKRAKPPYRPVIAVHGHGAWGHHLVAGVCDAQNKGQVEQLKEFNYDYGAELARAGFLVFVPCSRAHGDRMELDALAEQARNLKNQHVSSCDEVSKTMTLLGRSLIGLRVHDVGRVIDYVKTQPEPNTGRIGMVGLSGGGTVTTFTAATDRRVAAAVVCGYICTFRGSILAMPHCLCNFVPGLLKWAEMHDVAGLIAPRPLLVVSGTKDPIFPIKATRAACREIRRIYETLGAADRFAAGRFARDFFDGPHRWEGRAVAPFLAGCL